MRPEHRRRIIAAMAARCRRAAEMRLPPAYRRRLVAVWAGSFGRLAGMVIPAHVRRRIIATLARATAYGVALACTVGVALWLSGQTPTANPGPPDLSSPVTANLPQDEPPVAAAARFLAAWERRQYRAMYAMLSTSAKKTITESQFVKLYDDVMKQGAFVGVIAQVDRLALGSTALRIEETKRPAAAATPAAGKPAPKAQAPPEPLPRVSIPVQTTFESAQMGRFTERNVLPVVKEGDGWKIAWTPDALLKDFQVKGRVRLTVRDGTALRGRILDRNGNPLVWSEEVFKVGVVPGRMNDEATLLSVLSELSGLPKDAIKAKYFRQPQSWLIPITEIPATKRADVDSRLRNIGGIVLEEATMRRYAEPELAGPVLGLVGPYGPMDERPLAGRGYRDGDGIGRSGVEQALELDLNGIRGGSLALIAPDGGWVRLLAQAPRRDGKDVQLTLDRDLQRAAEAALTGDHVRGGLVVLDIASREVLAAVSKPGYDPGAVAANTWDQRWRWDVTDPSSAFANRTAALYPLTPIGEVLGAGGAELAKALGLGEPASAVGLPVLPETQQRGRLDLSASPLQVAALMAALADDRQFRLPVLAHRVLDADGAVSRNLAPKEAMPLPLRAEQAALLRWRLANLAPKRNVTEGPSEDAYDSAGAAGPVLPPAPTYGPVWFTGYAPADQPRYVVVGLAETMQQGGDQMAATVQALLQRLGQ